MLNRATRSLLAAIQALVGWEWLVSGCNKVFSGTFPQGLADTLNAGIKDNPNGWYVSFLQTVVLPHSVTFGYLIEWAEVTIGIVLLAGALLLLGRPRVRGEAQHGMAVAILGAVAVVAAAGAFLCVNFHFWMGHGLIPGLLADPNDEGIDLDALIPPLCLVILIANLAMIQALRGSSWFGQFRARLRDGFYRFLTGEERRELRTQDN
jgi:hypothetical protein